MSRRRVLLVGVIVALFVVALFVGPGQARDLDGFTRCLRSKRATFYGAAWCPQCDAQRALFGRAARWLPYVECSVGGTQAIRPECAGVTGFPTWTFRNGSRIAGRLSLERLARESGCALDAPVRDGPLTIDVPAGGGRRPSDAGVQIIEIP